MNLDEFITIEDGRELLPVLVKFAERYCDSVSRRDSLGALGVDGGFLSRIDTTGDPGRFARILQNRLREFKVSDDRPDYHPLASILAEFAVAPEDISLDDRETALCRIRLTEVQEKLKACVIRTAVCRIENADGAPIGTGVYLGRRIVLTCGHVFFGAELTGVRFRFGYYNEKRFIKRWNVFEPEPVFLSCGEAPDHALIRLKEAPKSSGVRLYKGDLTSRGPGAVIRMMHHPEGKPLEITEPGSIRLEADDFFCHDLPGKKQSSGSPLFNSAWELVGVHRGEDFARDCGEGLPEAVPVPSISVIKDHLPI